MVFRACNGTALRSFLKRLLAGMALPPFELSSSSLCGDIRYATTATTTAAATIRRSTVKVSPPPPEHLVHVYASVAAYPCSQTEQSGERHTKWMLTDLNGTYQQLETCNAINDNNLPAT